MKTGIGSDKAKLYPFGWEGKAFIEGIGYSYGFVEPLVIDPFEETSDLVCYTERGNEECEECDFLLNRRGQIKQKSISVYPNPVEDRLVFTLDESKLGSFQLFIFDDLGRLMENSILF